MVDMRNIFQMFLYREVLKFWLNQTFGLEYTCRTALREEGYVKTAVFLWRMTLKLAADPNKKKYLVVSFSNHTSVNSRRVKFLPSVIE